MDTRSICFSNAYVVKLKYGEDLLPCLTVAVQELGVTDGVVVCGVGSVSAYQVHAIQTTHIPPGNLFYGEEGPFDIVALQGYVIGGKVHAHITVADSTHTAAGHLEPGTIIHTFCSVTLLPVTAGDLDKLDEFRRTES